VSQSNKIVEARLDEHSPNCVRAKGDDMSETTC